MNMTIRGIIREASFSNVNVYACYNGFKGLVEGDILPLTNHDIRGILQHGGTIIGTERYRDFFEMPYRLKAFKNLVDRGIKGLIVIGGNGSMIGAHLLCHETGTPVIGIPASIDNDIFGTDMSIGVDTALNTIVYNVDKIKDTAGSHGRIFIVEVMGEACGYLALISAIASGALFVLIPELEDSFAPDMFCNIVYKAFRRSKKHAIIIKAEGFKLYDDKQIFSMISNYMDDRGIEKVSFRSTKLGHIQRGGSPSAFDRTLASKMASNAVRYLISGQKDVLVGLHNGDIAPCPLSDVITNNRNSHIKQLYQEYLQQELMMPEKLA
ncbi:MAG: ATP-dependent 6-phosphofructokinase [Desulfobacterales bacterium]|nr:ATP-dependent 6-phosphofructokinase [Desulfobacterales bacterium]MBF0398808.1 ATP-dependent 6-phosphofructokinase [Desulfobacterales bacterium]